MASVPRSITIAITIVTIVIIIVMMGGIDWAASLLQRWGGTDGAAPPLERPAPEAGACSMEWVGKRERERAREGERLIE